MPRDKPKGGNKNVRPSRDKNLTDDDSDEESADFLANRQDSRERRELRVNYGKLKENLQSNRLELVKPDSDGLQSTLAETEHFFANVKETREAALDSQVVALIAQITKQKAQALHTDLVTFEPLIFCDKLIRLVIGNKLPSEQHERARISPEGWVKLGEAAQPFFKRSPSLQYMLGSFDRGPVQPRVKPVRVPRPKDKDLQKGPTAPKEIKSIVADPKSEATTVEVERVLSLLQDFYNRWDKRPICYFEFVVNPNSFGQTIENIFYVSFLVKDNCARITLDEDKLPVIEPVETQPGQGELDVQDKHQVVITITQPEWREIVRTFNIINPLIPNRRAAMENDENDASSSNSSVTSTASIAKKPRR